MLRDAGERVAGVTYIGNRIGSGFWDREALLREPVAAGGGERSLLASSHESTSVDEQFRKDCERDGEVASGDPFENRKIGFDFTKAVLVGGNGLGAPASFSASEEKARKAAS